MEVEGVWGGGHCCIAGCGVFQLLNTRLLNVPLFLSLTVLSESPNETPETAKAKAISRQVNLSQPPC